MMPGMTQARIPTQMNLALSVLLQLLLEALALAYVELAQHLLSARPRCTSSPRSQTAHPTPILAKARIPTRPTTSAGKLHAAPVAPVSATNHRKRAGMKTRQELRPIARNAPTGRPSERPNIAIHA